MKLKLAIAILFSVLFTFGTFAQETKIKKPKTYYFIDGKEVTKEDVYKLKTEQIKNFNTRISDEQKDQLIKKYGDEAEDARIMEISLKTEEEIKNTKTITPEEAAVINKKNAEEQAKKIKESTLVNTGDLAPDFSVEMLDGKNIKLSDLKGKVVLLNFWATWCAPCMRELYEMPEKILQPFSDKNFVFLPISRGEKKEVVSKKIEKLKNKGVIFNAGLDPAEDIFQLYATNYIPRNYLIDQNGKVVYTSIGYSEEKLDELITKIEELLK